MENPSIIIDGRKLDVRKMDEMYTVTINGLPFTSQTIKGLVDALGNFYNVQTVYDYVIPQVSLTDKLKGLLTVSPLLSDRQKALRQLELLSDPEAIRAVDVIKSKPVSFGATYLTKVLNKKHFSEVSQVEISDLVTNITHRSEMMKELSELVKL
jgi:hypothetical protein